MVKLTAPLGSAAANGKLADTLIFQSTKGRSTVKKYRKPANPRSPAQTGIRLMIAFLNEQWPLLTPDQIATWIPDATQPKRIPSTNFNGINLARWGNFKGPSKSNPATEDDVLPTPMLFTAYWTKPAVYLRLTTFTLNDIWAHAYHRSQTTGFAPTHRNCIAIQQVTAPGLNQLQDFDVKPGVYFYRQSVITSAGRLHLNPLQRTVTVTPF